MLRRSVEVALHTSQLHILPSQVLVEKTGSLGVEVVITAHGEEEPITLLIELLDGDSILLLVLEHEICILEAGVEVHVGGQINRSLLLANGADLAFLWSGKVEVGVAVVGLFAKLSRP